MGPLLRTRCVTCHNDQDRKGGLSLNSRESFAAGGDSGSAIEPGDPESSLLMLMVTPAEGSAEMPKGGPPLTESELRVLVEWIRRGASWPADVRLEATEADARWWSLRPLTRPPLPQLAEVDRQWARTPIDLFVAAAMHREGLAPADEADRKSLIRRLYFDLVGLPPSPEQVQQFLADSAPDAYERLVDWLLASPGFGERWGRHWLDVVHYGDSHGYDKDKPRPHAWPYRDYVIRAWNEDKPYEQFIVEQIAGDIARPDDPQATVALGFLAAGPWDFISHVEVPESKIDGQRARSLDRDDMVRTVMEVFNSFTVGCARCHDHKFDPVSQVEYYALQAVFAAVDRANRPYDDDPERFRRRRELLERRWTLQARRDALKAQVEQVRGERQDVERALEVVESELEALGSPQWVYAAATRFEPEGTFHPTGGVPREIRVLHRGNVQSPGQLVEPAAPRLFQELGGTFQLPPEHDEAERRLALAHWLASADNSLTWRSMANRLWQHMMGRGLVATPNDFGRMGQLPTHPQLLDWLAVELRDGDQSLKRLVRMICLSATYRQASAAGEASGRDGENRWLSRGTRKRLEAEPIRDAVLAVSGLLDRRMYGPAFQDFVIEKPEHSPHYQYHLHDPSDPTTHRRSVYRFLVRSQHQPFMTALDCADPSMHVAVRDETITPQQALAMLNDPLMLYAAEAFARRLEREERDTPKQVERAVWLALGRPPDGLEAKVLEQLAGQHGLPAMCRALFSLNEFVFVD